MKNTSDETVENKISSIKESPEELNKPITRKLLF